MVFTKSVRTVPVMLVGVLLSMGAPAALAQCEVAELIGHDTVADDGFSFESAACIDGDYVVVGAPFSNNGGGGRSGSAYVFFNDDGTWIEVAKLVPSDPEPDDTFGIRVCISGDWIVVGAHEHTHGTGSAYFFLKPPGGWENMTETQKVIPADAEVGDSFGVGVSIDGDYALIGAFYDDDAGPQSGAAYVYVNDNGTWTEQAKLTPLDLAAGDRFGYSVSLSGGYALVGSHYHDHAGSNAGAAYLFWRDDNGTPGDPNDDTWVEVSEITASDAQTGDVFGGHLAMRGSDMVIGAPMDDDGGAESGAAYIFWHDDNGTPEDPADDDCVEIDKLVAYDTEAGDYFGFSVAIDEDMAVIGANGADATGAAYLFQRDDNGTPADPSDDDWVPGPKLIPDDAMPDDGVGLAVSKDGDFAVIGASRSDEAGDDSGSAYMYVVAGPDCNDNGILDECDIADCDGSPWCDDCNDNGVPDECDIAASAKVYWTDWTTDKIQRSDLDGSNLEDVIVSGLTTPVGIAVDLLGRKVYWADQTQGKIRRANLDGTEIEDIVTDLDQPQDIALDIAGAKVYWIDHGTDGVFRADMHNLNSNVEPLYQPFPGELHGIALDLVAGMVYWTWQTESKLMRAPMDGAGPVEELLLDLPYEIFGVAVDSVNGHMYWSSFPSETIWRGDLDAGNAEVFVSDAGHPIDLAVDPVGGYLYWARYLAGQGNEKVQRTRLQPGSPAEDIVTGLEDIWGICVLPTSDCNDNDILDECDMADCDGSSWCDDCNGNGMLDVCEPDFDGDGLIDDCDPDIDNDGVPNEDDACNYTPLGANIVTDPDDPLYGTLRGDLDGDCDCDLEDFALMQADFTGPNGL